MDKATRQTEHNNELEIDLGALFRMLVHHWIRIVISVILMVVVFFCIARYFVTPEYSSTSILYVLHKSTSITSLSDIEIGSDLTNDYIEVVAGRPVLDQVAENLDLDLTYSEMSDKVTVSNPSDSRMLRITVTDPDPNEAKIIADEIAVVSSAFISQKMHQDAPEIIQYGYVNSSPSSPNYMRYLALGALIGFLLPVVILLIEYFSNNTVMTTDDLEQKLGLRVLGSLSDEEDKRHKERTSDKSGKIWKNGNGSGTNE